VNFIFKKKGIHTRDKTLVTAIIEIVKPSTVLMLPNAGECGFVWENHKKIKEL